MSHFFHLRVSVFAFVSSPRLALAETPATRPRRETRAFDQVVSGDFGFQCSFASVFLSSFAPPSASFTLLIEIKRSTFHCPGETVRNGEGFQGISDGSLLKDHLLF